MIDGMTAWIIEKKIYWQTAWLTLACRANRGLQATLENEIYPSQKNFTCLVVTRQWESLGDSFV